jgi:hypothetical protein
MDEKELGIFGINRNTNDVNVLIKHFTITTTS